MTSSTPITTTALGKILVADEDQGLRERMKVFLANAGYSVAAAALWEAAADLQDGAYDLVIADFQGPKESATRLADELAKASRTELIITTSAASTASAIDALHQEALDYLLKPMDYETLLVIVEKAFARIQAERFREDMVSMLTHDIKIPLSSIIGYSALIFDKETGEPHQRAREFVRIIEGNGVKIQTLIDNFLTTCRIDAGKLHIVRLPVNLNDIFGDLKAMFEMDAERKGLRLEVRLAPDLPSVEGDETLLFRAAANALSNACKFTPPGGVVTVRTQGTDKHVRFEVANSGPGIPPEDIDRVFERFVRGRGLQRADGSGLGLFVLKSIVEIHGGLVRMESVPNHLTTLTVMLPFTTDA